VSKSLFTSRIFWVNAISASLEVAQALSGLNVVPSGALTIVSNCLTIALRVVTKTPVHVVSQEQ
jgi:hypothetical protein